MPERFEPGHRQLDDRLGTARDRLLDEIKPPDLAVVVNRAARIRQRRLVGRASGLAAALAVVLVLAVRPWAGGPAALPDDVATTPEPTPASFAVYTEAGVTVNGLVVHQSIAEIPGDVRDVEFFGADLGWALAARCPSGEQEACELTLAALAPDGLTWVARPLAGVAVPAGVPDLVVLGPRTLVLHGPDRSAFSTDGGDSWEATSGEPGPVLAAGLSDRLLLRPGTADRCRDSGVEVWTRNGLAGELKYPPAMDICWVAPAPAADGGWWVGGTDPTSGGPAVAVSPDGGANWRSVPLPGAPAGRAMVTWAGRHTYVVVAADQGGRTALRAIYHSAAPGDPFTRTWVETGRAPRTLAGEMVATLDGRLVVSSDNRWYVSADDGASFAVLSTERMPGIGALTRTPGGFVSYDTVARGWPAFSSDGATWRKLHVH